MKMGKKGYALVEPGTGELERQSLDPVFSDQRETE